MKTALLCCLGAVLCSQLPYIQGDTSFVKNVHVIFMNHLGWYTVSFVLDGIMW